MASSMIPQMIAALDLEVQAIKKKGASTSVELRGGERRGSVGSSTLYAFPLPEDVNLREDTPIHIVVDKKEYEGEIVSLGLGIIILTIDGDLGEKIPHARLISDDSFLLELLKRKLEEVETEEANFDHEIGEKALGGGQLEVHRSEIDPGVLADSYPLNTEQVEAISKALGSEILFLWGPPGTGKTTTLAKMVEGFYRAGLSVLLVSNTNIAVDTALEKVADKLQTEPIADPVVLDTD